MKAFYKSKLYNGNEYINTHINLSVEETEDSFVCTFPELLTEKLKDQDVEVIVLDGDVGEIDATFEAEINNKGELEVTNG